MFCSCFANGRHHQYYVHQSMVAYSDTRRISTHPSFISLMRIDKFISILSVSSHRQLKCKLLCVPCVCMDFWYLHSFVLIVDCSPCTSLTVWSSISFTRSCNHHSISEIASYLYELANLWSVKIYQFIPDRFLQLHGI